MTILLVIYVLLWNSPYNIYIKNSGDLANKIQQTKKSKNSFSE